MRHLPYFSAALVGLGLLAASAAPAAAFTNTSPAGLRAGTAAIDLAEPVHCRRYVHRHGQSRVVSRGCGPNVVIVTPPRRHGVIVRDRSRSSVTIRSGDGNRRGTSTSIRSGDSNRGSTSTTIRSGSGSGSAPATSTTTTTGAGASGGASKGGADVKGSGEVKGSGSSGSQSAPSATQSAPSTKSAPAPKQ